jgi:hypothetical protein
VTELGGGRRETLILVAVREIVQQIARREDAELRETFRGAFADAREIRDARGRCYLARRSNSEPTSSSGTSKCSSKTSK